MKCVNRYEPPPPAPPIDDLHETTPYDEYDINWAASKEVPVLRTKHVEIRCGIPSIHAKAMHKHVNDIKTATAIMGWDMTELKSMYKWFEASRRLPANLFLVTFVDPALFPELPPDAPAHFDDPTASPGTEHYILAGQCAVYQVSTKDLTACHGVSVFQQLEGRGIGTQVVALLMNWLMRLPSEGGLGFRRLEAGINTWNPGSIQLHTRLGMKLEGVVRNVSVVNKPARGDQEGREGDPQWPEMSRDEAQHSLTWQDWETGGVKERIADVLAGRKISAPPAQEMGTKPKYA